MQEPTRVHRGALVSNYMLAVSTTIATLFLAYQAWLARAAYVESSESRFVEKKLDLCFENFDAAAQLDAVLRIVDPSIAMQKQWPPRMTVSSPEDLARLKQLAVPRLDQLEGSLTKASALGGLDKYRGFLAQQLRGLSKTVSDLAPDAMAPGADPEEVEAALKRLSDLLGGQYSVFTGCRLIAEGKA